MTLQFSDINWAAMGVAFVAGQVFLTLWFTVFFGEAWAKAYHPNKTKAEHTKEVPGYTYGIGALCTAAVIIVFALLKAALGLTTITAGLGLAALLGLVLVPAVMVPGYVFLRRFKALALAAGSQIGLVFLVAAILSGW